MHHNPSLSLFILENNSFDKQRSEINKNRIFLRLDIYEKINQKLMLYMYKINFELVVSTLNGRENKTSTLI